MKQLPFIDRAPVDILNADIRCTTRIGMFPQIGDNRAAEGYPDIHQMGFAGAGRANENDRPGRPVRPALDQLQRGPV